VQIFFLSALFFSGLYFIDRTPAVDEQFRLLNADRLESFSPQPPKGELGWERVTFPDSQSANTSSYSSVWYRMSFDIEQFQGLTINEHERWAILISTEKANAAIYLNGSFLGNGGKILPPIPDYRHPLMFNFPASLLREQGNELYYHYVRGTPSVYAEAVYIAPSALLEPWFSNAMFMKKHLRVSILIMMAVIASIMLLMFVQRPQDKFFGWYSAAIIVWMAHHGIRIVDHLPIGNPYQVSALAYSTLGLFVAFASQYIGSFINLRIPTVDKLILAWSILGSVILFVVATLWGNTVNILGEYIWVPGILLTGCYSVGALFVRFFRDNNTEVHLLLVSVGLLLVTGVRDYLFDFTDLVPGSTFYLQYTGGLVLAFWSVILMRRFAIALNTTEILNNELEQRIAEKTAELQDFYLKVSGIEKERALVEERERIMRDMHDGLGGQLIQVLSLAEQNPQLSPVRQTLKLALSDLRLIIDSLSISDGDLTTVLGTFRHRTEKMITAVGLEYDWHVEDVPMLKQMGPASALQVLRILQETISNIMQHAAASVITVRTKFELGKPSAKPMVVIEIQDDGKGFVIPPEAKENKPKTHGGHGLANMQYRAQRVGCTLVVSSSSEGTLVQLFIPVI